MNIEKYLQDLLKSQDLTKQQEIDLENIKRSNRLSSKRVRR